MLKGHTWGATPRGSQLLFERNFQCSNPLGHEEILHCANGESALLGLILRPGELSPLMALSGRANRADECPLSGGLCCKSPRHESTTQQSNPKDLPLESILRGQL